MKALSSLCMYSKCTWHPVNFIFFVPFLESFHLPPPCCWRSLEGCLWSPSFCSRVIVSEIHIFPFSGFIFFLEEAPLPVTSWEELSEKSELQNLVHLRMSLSPSHTGYRFTGCIILIEWFWLNISLWHFSMLLVFRSF